MTKQTKFLVVTPVVQDHPVPFDEAPLPGVQEAFKDVIPHVDLLMSRDIGFERVYKSTRTRSKVPALTPCVVDCRPSWSLELENRAIAFAVRDRGHLRWYGITAWHQEPAELAGVKQYVQVSKVIDHCRAIAFQNGPFGLQLLPARSQR